MCPTNLVETLRSRSYLITHVTPDSYLLRVVNLDESIWSGLDTYINTCVKMSPGFCPKKKQKGKKSKTVLQSHVWQKWKIWDSFNNAVHLIMQHHVGSLSAMLDLADTFKHILVHPENWPLLASTWEAQQTNSTMCKEYYMDPFLSFACTSLCCSSMNTPTPSSLPCVIINHVPDILHYLDDFFTTFSPNSSQCQLNIDTMVQTYMDLGFSINPSKVTPPPQSPISWAQTLILSCSRHGLTQSTSTIVKELQHVAQVCYLTRQVILSYWKTSLFSTPDRLSSVIWSTCLRRPTCSITA